MPYRKTLKLELSSLAKDDLRDIAQYTFTRYGERQVDIYLQALYDGMELRRKTRESATAGTTYRKAIKAWSSKSMC